MATMETGENRYFVVSNSLISDINWTLNKSQLKIFLFFVSYIDTNHPPKDRIVHVSKRELLKFLSSNGHVSNNTLTYRNFALSLMTPIHLPDKIINNVCKSVYVPLIDRIEWQYIKRKKIDEKNNDISSFSSSVSLNTYKLSTSSINEQISLSYDDIGVRFSEEIFKYLIVSKKFFQMPIYDLQSFNTKWGILLYSLLLSHYKQYNETLISYKLDDLKWCLGTYDSETKVHSYNKWYDFENNVLKVARDEINNIRGLEIQIDYKTIRNGRKIVGIEFYIKPRTINNINNVKGPIRERMKALKNLIHDLENCTDVTEFDNMLPSDFNDTSFQNTFAGIYIQILELKANLMKKKNFENGAIGNESSENNIDEDFLSPWNTLSSDTKKEQQLDHKKDNDENGEITDKLDSDNWYPF